MPGCARRRGGPRSWRCSCRCGRPGLAPPASAYSTGRQNFDVRDGQNGRIAGLFAEELYPIGSSVANICLVNLSGLIFLQAPVIQDSRYHSLVVSPTASTLGPLILTPVAHFSLAEDCRSAKRPGHQTISKPHNPEIINSTATNIIFFGIWGLFEGRTGGGNRRRRRGGKECQHNSLPSSLIHSLSP